MNLLNKVKETTASVIPIILIVSILHFTVSPLERDVFTRFLYGSLFIIAGLSLFLTGSELSVIPFGQMAGSALVRQRKSTILLLSGLIIGIVITIAEPQVQILSSQISRFNPTVSPSILIITISVGVGLFTSAALLRVLLGFSFRWTILAFYLLVALVAVIGDSYYIPIAFDAGGATTGPLTVPFIIALGIGVSTVRKGEKREQDSFGLVGIASIGPILAVLLIPFFSPTKTGGGHNTTAEITPSLSSLIQSSLTEVLQSMAPLILLFLVFHFTLLHMQRRQIIRSIEGMLYTIGGLVMFLAGVNGTLIPVGSALGISLSALRPESLLILTGLVFGGAVVLAEPAVWVLTDQIRNVSGGTISQRLVMVFFSAGVSIAVALAMVRIIYSIPLSAILLPGYAAAMLLSLFSPPLFTAIAFDSGGVASGPLSSSFLLAFALGVSNARGGNPMTDGFGMVSLVAMTPLISLQILGILYKIKTKKDRPKEVT